MTFESAGGRGELQVLILLTKGDYFPDEYQLLVGKPWLLEYLPYAPAFFSL
jgi:hypothetical protein